MNDCLFCKISNKEIPATIVFENDEIIAFRDINPQAPVHIIIIPKLHIATTENLTEENYHLAGKLIFAASQISRQLKLEGYRLVVNCNEIAGQTIFHLHLHLLGGRTMHWPPG